MGTGDNLQKGYSLVELMVALVLTMLATIAIYKGFVSFMVAADVQEQEVEIQQGLRVGVQRMVKELRMVGFDPGGEAEAGFVATAATSVSFSIDYNNDGDTDDSNVDIDADGNPDVFFDEEVIYSWGGADGNPLQRTDLNGGGVGVPGPALNVVPNVSFLQFRYLNDDSPPVTPTDDDDIRNIEITLVVRAANIDASYVNNRNYTNMDGTTVFTAPGDNFRRKQLLARVKPRNMGLN